MVKKSKYMDSIERAIRSVNKNNPGIRNIARQSKVIYIGDKYNVPYQKVMKDFNKNYNKVVNENGKR